MKRPGISSGCKSTSEPTPKPTNPSGASRVPLFSMREPMRAILPLGQWIVPKLTTAPLPAPAKSKLCALRKSSFRTSKLAATNPAVSTRAWAPNRIPFGFNKNTWPLENKLPKISLHSEPITRLRTAPWGPAWLKTTFSPKPIENLSHSMIALPFVWMIHSPGIEDTGGAASPEIW